MAEESTKKEEYKECPHCKGATTCMCGTCVVYVTGPFTGLPFPRPGICKVCDGTGRIPE